MQTKKCTKCKRILPISSFSKQRGGRDGLRSICRECNNAAGHKRYAADPAKTQATTRKWQAANPDRVQAYRKRAVGKYGPADRERAWCQKIWRRYGLRPADYWQLFAQQEGVCGMCGKPEMTTTATGKGPPMKMSIDHDHQSGEIRGLLCSKCNHGLGCLNDDPQLLRTGAVWVRTAKTGMFVPET